ncbi:MAG: STAS domain-containing protein [Candidatus Methylacidiphilales bacterium]|nr:STAS domain-containing protein [Candidatus Methylacidiphilales bacterium]
MRLDIAEREEDGWIIFSLAGSIDNYTANDFRERVEGRMRDVGKGIILDCSGLNFVSSAGLRVFVILAKQVAASDNRNLLTVSNVRPTLMRFFEVAGVGGMLRFVPSLDIAMNPKPV